MDIICENITSVKGRLSIQVFKELHADCVTNNEHRDQWHGKKRIRKNSLLKR